MKNNRRNFVFSDPHFGDTGLYEPREKYNNTILRPEFLNCEQADQVIIENINKLVPKHDSDLYILGDLGKNITIVEKIISQLNGERKFLILGNHDSKFVTHKLSMLFDKIYGAFYFKNYIFTHIPIHYCELRKRKRKRKNIHGHVHTNSIIKFIDDGYCYDERYINACLEVNNYKPIEILENGEILNYD